MRSTGNAPFRFLMHKIHSLGLMIYNLKFLHISLFYLLSKNIGGM